MKYTVAFALVTFLVGFPVGVSAQQTGPSAPLATAAQTLPAQSFEDLRTRLRVGDKLVVRNAEGKATRGRLLALEGHRIEIESWRWFRLRHRVFSDTNVRRVEIEDPTWNGWLIGLGVGGAASGIVCMADHSESGYGCVIALVSVPIFGSFGGAVDWLKNRPVYEAPGGPSSITLSPIFGVGRIGLAARVRL